MTARYASGIAGATPAVVGRPPRMSYQRFAYDGTLRVRDPRTCAGNDPSPAPHELQEARP